MKKIITLVTLVLSTLITFAQHNVLQGIHDNFLFQEKENPKFEERFKEVEFPKLRNNNGTIWVQDSSYSFSFNDGYEYLDSRKRVYSRDEFGHATIEMNHFWDDNTQNWIKGDTITTSFYNENQRNKYFSRPWNTELQEWADTSSYRKYSVEGASLIYLYSSWDFNNNEFLYRHKFYHILDEIGNDSCEIHYDWNNNVQEWKFYEKLSYTYDISGNLLQTITQHWSYVSNTWVNEFQYINTYNDNGKLTQQLFQIWNNETSTWNNTSLRFINYDDNGNESQVLYQGWDIVTSVWINTSQQLYNYDDNGNKVHFLSQVWIVETNSWVNNRQNLSTYDINNNRTLQLNQNWDTELNVWINNKQTLYTYNTNENRILTLYQNWNNETNVWENDTQYLFTYDDNGNRTQGLFQNWDIEAWESFLKNDYYWSEYEVEKVNSKENNILIYPNPANNMIRIEGINKAKISIYSMNGKLIKQTKLQNNEVDISDLQEGAYMIKITYDNQIFTKQIIKE